HTAAAFDDLDVGFGREVLALNKETISEARSHTLQQFDCGLGVPRRSLIVCLYGSPEYLMLQCALFSGCPGFHESEIIYVNNSPELAETLSRDAQEAARLYDLRITLVTPSANIGFAAANNLGVQHAQSDRILIVNPDVFPY